MKITDEVLKDQPDLVGQIQRRLNYGVIQSERSKLAAVSSWQLAWEVYLPTPLDKPEDYAPYLVRLTDAVTDATEREAIVASWLDHNRT